MRIERFGGGGEYKNKGGWGGGGVRTIEDGKRWVPRSIIRIEWMVVWEQDRMIVDELDGGMGPGGGRRKIEKRWWRKGNEKEKEVEWIKREESGGKIVSNSSCVSVSRIIHPPFISDKPSSLLTFPLSFHPHLYYLIYYIYFDNIWIILHIFHFFILIYFLLYWNYFFIIVSIYLGFILALILNIIINSLWFIIH